MKSTTYIVEITNQKDEKYLSEGRNPLAWLPPRFLALCQLRNFLHEFSEKCLVVFNQSICGIYLMWCWLVLFFWENFIVLFMV